MFGLKKWFGGNTVDDDADPEIDTPILERPSQPAPWALAGAESSQTQQPTSVAGAASVSATAPLTPVAATTVVAADTEIEGEVSTASAIVVEGAIRGDVRSVSTVKLQRDASVEGRISGSDVAVEGTVHGDVEASGKLTIAATGVITGDVSSRGMRIDEGGRLHGRCSMGEGAEVAPPIGRSG